MWSWRRDLNPRPSDYKPNPGAARGVNRLILLALSAERRSGVLSSIGTKIGTFCWPAFRLRYQGSLKLRPKDRPNKRLSGYCGGRETNEHHRIKGWQAPNRNRRAPEKMSKLQEVGDHGGGPWSASRSRVCIWPTPIGAGVRSGFGGAV